MCAHIVVLYCTLLSCSNKQKGYKYTKSKEKQCTKGTRKYEKTTIPFNATDLGSTLLSSVTKFAVS